MVGPQVFQLHEINFSFSRPVMAYRNLDHITLC